jgi:hypothetical protein
MAEMVQLLAPECPSQRILGNPSACAEGAKTAQKPMARREMDRIKPHHVTPRVWARLAGYRGKPALGQVLRAGAVKDRQLSASATLAETARSA